MINEKLKLEYEKNNPQTVMEIQAQMSQDDLSVDMLTAVRESRLALGGVGGQSAVVAEAEELQRNLVENNFQVLTSQIQADVQTIRIHSQKETTAASALYWRNLDWRRNQFQFFEKKATDFVNEHITLVTCPSTPLDLVKKFADYKLSVCKKFHLGPNDLALEGFFQTDLRAEFSVL